MDSSAMVKGNANMIFFVLTGQAYNNEYVWLTTWNDEGKIIHIRSYFDTLLAQQTLEDP